MATKRVLTPIKAENGNAEVTSPNPQKKFKEQLEFPADELENIDWGDNDDFDLEAIGALDSISNHRLDLKQWQRCQVEEMEQLPKKQGIKIHVKRISGGDPETAVCQLHAPWNSMPLAVGDTVSLIGKWEPSAGCYVVDKEQGFCVSQPDFLISGTTVTGSLFCKRKSVLQERFRGLDSGSSVMVIGTLVHELLQKVLRQKLSVKAHIQSALKEMLASSSLAHLLYASNLSQAEMETQLYKFVDPIVSFVSQYVKGETPTVLPPEVYRGRIHEIRDIEENLWVPQLGLKGKVDVSVKVKNQLRKEEIIPLELKTGRASFSMEHKGQLLLYQLMHSAQGRDTKSGLLLYLREGLLREVPSGRNEQRDLVMLRNDLAHWLTKEITIPDGKEDPLEQMQLPEPVYHHSACGNCPYSTICSSFAERDADLQLSESHPLKKLMPQLLGHLKEPDHAYVQHWCGLLALEEQHNRQSSHARSFWTEDPVKREKQGRAIGQLKLVKGQKVTLDEGRYRQSLELGEEADASRDLNLSGFDLGEYVVISSSSRLAIASGYIASIEARRLDLRLERDLSQLYSQETFIMDKHESQSFATFNFTNLGILLSEGERFQELRDIIVARKPPEQHKVLPKIILTKGATLLQDLNKVQRAAALRALTTSSHLLIKGLPGTGKTQTLVSLVRLLHLLGKSVLITAQTHSAVDNLLMRLLPFDLPMMRLGSSSRIHVQLEEISEERLTKDCKTVEELEKALEKPSIVGVTCLGAGHPLFQRRQFDYCIVDEATQVLQPTVLRPLMYCSKFVLVGDPEQLPPIVRSKEARQRGADETLFQRLDCEQATAVLSLQYRMNKTITRLANELTYGGDLKCASDEVSDAKFQVELSNQAPRWVQRSLTTHLEQSVTLINTGDCLERCQEFIQASQRLAKTCSSIEQCFGEDKDENKKQNSKKRISKYTNYCEAGIVMHLLRHLLKSGFEASRIGVIAPYRAQVELLKKLAFKLDPQLECNTVDQFQGRDKNLIIYSCSKTGGEAFDMERSREAEILEDQRRLTVAITRAKNKLIVLGDIECLEQYGPFRRLFKHIPDRCRLKLEEGRMEFAWQRVQEDLTSLLEI
ncbi:DNA replication ATP-dependent helicase/nuclease DNA2 [Drosophila eugracilis]|uniref:DNA replication ATP-dependent helicase/nuclease DNA2 n=1 Tax=Drosophila eugracilis TaxID=29029 RepID=UPI0007E85F53|nr:DNA replication ATP-dependent helicase/nuclease DNA2 [Drosophila eugracilis]